MNQRFVCMAIAVVALLGCRQNEGLPAPAATPAAFNAAGAPTVELSVPDMMCEESCAAKVREVLSQQPGVKEVVVDFPNRTATVAVDQAEFDVEKAVRLLSDDYGFPNTHLKTP
jgi:copper chaperone CopZ